MAEISSRPALASISGNEGPRLHRASVRLATELCGSFIDERGPSGKKPQQTCWMPAQRVSSAAAVHCGWLYKQSDWLKHWRRRWVVIWAEPVCIAAQRTSRAPSVRHQARAEGISLIEIVLTIIGSAVELPIIQGDLVI